MLVRKRRNERQVFTLAKKLTVWSLFSFLLFFLFIEVGMFLKPEYLYYILAMNSPTSEG